MPKATKFQVINISNKSNKIGSGGYKYWGAAKDLPGVRELFAKEVPNAPRKSRNEYYRHINFEYYGFRDEEDENLLKNEKEAERVLMSEYVKLYI